jgi:NAD(P)-dependent dehydrogenase (short-subunit alcohol dehydrogenase family)
LKNFKHQNPPFSFIRQLRSYPQLKRHWTPLPFSLNRRGQPQDIAKAVVFLAYDDAAWITGEQVGVSGGMYGF